MKAQVNKKGWKKATLLLLTALLLVVVAACGKSTDKNTNQNTDNTVVATYDGGEVKASEFNEYLGVFAQLNPQYGQMLEIPEYKEYFLEMYVNYRIIGDKVSSEENKAAEKRVDKHLKELDDMMASNEKFKEQMKDLDRGAFKSFMMLEARVLEHFSAKLTEEDLQKTYDVLAPNFATITARHILVATQLQTDPEPLRTSEEAKARAEEVRKKLMDGGDWDELAKQYSDDPGSKDKGGLYEDAEAGRWVEQFKQAAFKQEIGVVGEPVEVAYGYHVIKVEKRTVPALGELKDEEKEAVNTQAASEYYQKYIEEEIPKLNVKLNLPKPSAAPSAEPSGEPAASVNPSAEPQETPAASTEAAK